MKNRRKRWNEVNGKKRVEGGRREDLLRYRNDLHEMNTVYLVQHFSKLAYNITEEMQNRKHSILYVNVYLQIK